MKTFKGKKPLTLSCAKTVRQEGCMGNKFKSKGETQEARGFWNCQGAHQGPWWRRLGQGGGGEDGLSESQTENSRARGHPQTHTDIRGSSCFLKPGHSQLSGQGNGLQLSLPSTSARGLANHRCSRLCFLISKIPLIVWGTINWTRTFEEEMLPEMYCTLQP